ncbi:uncharacterized protein [Ptychodera flava]|uniref:uncharacterized protein n=1 Tax=Ptychodera flava TaxID=63121 RepID=UPI00396A17DA
MKSIIVIIFALLAAEIGAKDGAFYSSSWVCAFASVRVYDDAIWNVYVTKGVDCPEDVNEIPKLVENETPAKAFDVYYDIGSFIENTRTFRLMSVVVDQVDTIDLGELLPEEGHRDCLNCTLNYYKGDILEVICDPPEVCPNRLTEGVYWGQPEGTSITFSSPVVYCAYQQLDGTDYLFCKDYHPDNHMVE